MAQEYHGKLLMGGNVSYTQLASLLSRGAEIKHTKLSDNFTYQDYLAHHKGNSVVPLFHVEEKGKIQFCDDPEQFAPTTTSTVVSLILSESAK